jgi:hypothetical protein
MRLLPFCGMDWVILCALIESFLSQRSMPEWIRLSVIIHEVRMHIPADKD